MNIVVLLKAVPVVGTEKLGSDLLTDRSVQLEANGNDEYLLEKALKLTETHGGEVTVLTVGPQGATEALRKALAMGAARAVHVADNAMKGSDTRATVEVLAAALRKLEFDLAFVGADTSDGQGGVVGAAVAVELGMPYLSYAQEIEPTDSGVKSTASAPPATTCSSRRRRPWSWAPSCSARRATPRCAGSCRLARSPWTHGVSVTWVWTLDRSA